MNLLLIDSTKTELVVGLAVDWQLVQQETCAEQRQHDKNINALINRLRTRDFDAVAVVTGPGSWTGIRVGLAVAKAYAYARQIPIIPLTHQIDIAVAQQKWQQQAFVTPFTLKPFYDGEFIVKKKA